MLQPPEKVSKLTHHVGFKTPHRVVFLPVTVGACSGYSLKLEPRFWSRSTVVLILNVPKTEAALFMLTFE